MADRRDQSERDPVVHPRRRRHTDTGRAISDFRINDETLEEFAASHESTALVVVHDGEILLEKYFQGNDRESLQSGISCTKSVVSLLVGIAIDEGLIGSVDDPIADYVKGLNPEFDNVTVRQLLTMTSGISDTDEKLFGVVPAPWSDEVRGYYDPDLRRLAKSFSLDHPPGERFEYHDFNPILIGMMLENVTGQSLTEYLSSKIWQPAGMQFPARWSIDSRRHGFEKPESGLHARAIDFARLGAVLADPQQTIVSRDWVLQSVLDRHAGQLVQERFAPNADRAESRGAHELAEHIARCGTDSTGGASNGLADMTFMPTGTLASSFTSAPRPGWSSSATAPVTAA